ncbi:MAG TPA: signal peptidase I [Candidatus Bathyarchaeia archaeon]|nr:signal peptidase I [Candidatus Bathyarchaeia archaeon]
MSTSGRVLWTLILLAMTAVVVALPLAVRHRFEGVWIPSTSMAPTLLVGDYVLIDKAAHWPVRGDLVVFVDPKDANELLVKRIVGVGGEEIAVHGHDVYVNCEPPTDGCRPLAEPYADFSDAERADRDAGPVEIPSESVFVMADNRNAGEDSRHWGPVSRDRIVGRPLWIYWSSDAEGHTRWSRVGSRIH